MRKFLLALLLSPCMVVAQNKHDAAEVKKDIERHKQMAAAHAAMAKCLESGSQPEQCQKTLQGACKGLAIGKYCGMKHEH